jgi:hypothetical protein
MGNALKRMGNGSRLALFDMGLRMGEESALLDELPSKLLLLLLFVSALFMLVAFIFKFETSVFIMHSFFLAFVVVFALFKLAAEFKLFNRFEHVSVFFNLGIDELLDVSFELKFKLDTLFELLLVGVVSIFIV